MSAQSQQSDVLQKLNSVKRKIVEVRKKALYRRVLKNTCLLQGYCDGKFSFIFNFEAARKIDDELPVPAVCRLGAAREQFTVLCYGNSMDLPNGVKTEEQEVLVRNVKIVQCPDGRVIPSIVRLDLGHNAFVQPDASGIYLNPMKGTMDILPSIADGELGGMGNLVRQQSENCAMPSEVKRAAQVMNSVPSNQGQFVQGISEVRDFVYKGLSTVRVILDCGSTTILQRSVRRFELLDVFFGPLDLESGISVECAHNREVYADTLG